MMRILTLILLVLNVYVLTPVYATSDCEGAPDSRLKVGDTGQVTMGVEHLRLRALPAVGAGTLHTLSTGTPFTVIAGPSCNSGYYWWRVDVPQKGVGWVAEGDQEQFYLQPDIAPVPLAEDLLIVWTSGGTIYTYDSQSAESILLLERQNPIEHLSISPTGEYVAFVEHSISGPQLMITTTDPTQSSIQSWTPPLQNVFDALQWGDANTLIFSTAIQDMMGYTSPGAIHRWEVGQGIPDNLGEALNGAFSVSPDGRYMALSQPGDYERNPAQLLLITLEDLSAQPVLSYDSVSTASEYAFVPPIHWLADGSGFYAAIPSPDLVYAFDGPVPPTALWRISITGDAVQIGEIEMDFFGGPQWRDDDQKLLYRQQSGDITDNLSTLFIADADGTNAQAYATDQIHQHDWLDGQRGFVYLKSGQGNYWLAQPESGQADRPLYEGDVFDPIFEQGTVVYIGSLDPENYTLHVLSLDNPDSGPVMLGTSNTLPLFDIGQRLIHEEAAP